MAYKKRRGYRHRNRKKSRGHKRLGKFYTVSRGGIRM